MDRFIGTLRKKFSYVNGFASMLWYLFGVELIWSIIALVFWFKEPKDRLLRSCLDGAKDDQKTIDACHSVFDPNHINSAGVIAGVIAVFAIPLLLQLCKSASMIFEKTSFLISCVRWLLPRRCICQEAPEEGYGSQYDPHNLGGLQIRGSWHGRRLSPTYTTRWVVPIQGCQPLLRKQRRPSRLMTFIIPLT